MDVAMLQREPVGAEDAGHQPRQPMAQPAVSALLHAVSRRSCSVVQLQQQRQLSRSFAYREKIR